MTNIMGIDYGEKKTGVAIAEGASLRGFSLAHPHSVVRHKTERELIQKLKKIIEEERVEMIIVGVSEGNIGQRARAFAVKISKEIGTEVDLQDETLSTYEAQKLSIKGGIRRKKRRLLEDAYSAALILQSYLDSKETADLQNSNA